MNAMPMFSAMAALTEAAMMVGMMLPSLAATVWRYHRDLRTMRVPRAGMRTLLFAAAYALVWAAVSLLLYAMSVAPWPGLNAAANASSMPLAAGAVVLFAGAIQRSRWKARRLARCRRSCVSALVAPSLTTAWRSGCEFGVDCILSCAAPMAILLIAGLMNVAMMIVITAAIASERVMRAGVRIARLTGSIALVTGAMMCLRAIRDHGFVLAIHASAVSAPQVYANAPTQTRGTQSEHRPVL